MAELFSFRPAPLRARGDWTLDGETLDGPGGRHNLTPVSRARFVETSIRGMRLRRLDLEGPEGLIRIGLNTTVTLPPDDPDRAAHRALLIAVARCLAARDPDLPVSIGEGRGWRLVWFGLGALSLLAGPGIGIAALASGVSDDRPLAAAVPVLMLGALGIVLMRSYSPWKKPPHFPVSILPKVIDSMDGTPRPAD